MSQDTVSATAEKICRALVGDARKVDCDIIESHIREMLVADPSDSAETHMPQLNDAMRAVLRNENSVYGSEDELYAALCAAARAATRAKGEVTLTDKEVDQIGDHAMRTARATAAFGKAYQRAYIRAILAAQAHGSEARNAARYRWIEKNAHFTGRYKDIGGFGVCVKLELLERDGIGAAIDAEMKRRGEQKD